MIDTKDRKFVKAYMNDEIYTWIDKQAESMGMSKSAFVNMCVSNYKQQLQAITSMSQMDVYIAKMEQLIEKNNK